MGTSLLTIAEEVNWSRRLRIGKNSCEFPSNVYDLAEGEMHGAFGARIAWIIIDHLQGTIGYASFLG